ncbi:hypothetical protein GCM10009706_14530 [Curtobacterium citreum]|nr:hypothetical protein FB462_2058 [Curtobacterium citreum]GGL77156.1 hypothetical protein GCM10009706_14530 [Curtobacterium citreum]
MSELVPVRVVAFARKRNPKRPTNGAVAGWHWSAFARPVRGLVRSLHLSIGSTFHTAKKGEPMTHHQIDHKHPKEHR